MEGREGGRKGGREREKRRERKRTDKETDVQTVRKTDMQTDKRDRQTDRQTDRQNLCVRPRTSVRACPCALMISTCPGKMYRPNATKIIADRIVVFLNRQTDRLTDRQTESLMCAFHDRLRSKQRLGEGWRVVWGGGGERERERERERD